MVKPTIAAKLALLCAAAAISIAWLTWPSKSQIDIDSCSPDGFVASLTAYVHAKRFWGVQLVDITLRRETAEKSVAQDQLEQKVRAYTNELVTPIFDKIYKDHPELAPSLEQQERAKDYELKEAEADREVSELLNRYLAALQRCEELISRNIE